MPWPAFGFVTYLMEFAFIFTCSSWDFPRCAYAALSMTVLICVAAWWLGLLWVLTVMSTHCMVTRAVTSTNCMVTRAVMSSHCMVTRAVTSTHCMVTRAVTSTYCMVTRAVTSTHCMVTGAVTSRLLKLVQFKKSSSSISELELLEISYL